MPVHEQASEFEVRQIRKIVKAIDSGTYRKSGVRWSRLVFHSLLFPLAYIFRENIVLIPLLAMIWVAYIMMGFGYMKNDELNARIIYKLVTLMRQEEREKMTKGE